jgi:DNA-binding NarL/FixJ family response regulator
MRLLIVDDHEVVREGLIAALTRDLETQVVAAVGTGEAAIERAEATSPDVALVDLRLPDMTGDELCAALRQRCPSTAVVILTTYLSVRLVRDSLRAGASEYVTKAAGVPELRAAIARAGNKHLNPDADASPQIVQQLRGVVAARMSGSVPTPQQERVLELAAQGLTDAEIGKQLCISTSTVRFHVQNLKVTFDARTKTDLIAKALRTGVISVWPDDAMART